MKPSGKHAGSEHRAQPESSATHLEHRSKTPSRSGSPISLEDVVISQELIERPLRRVNRRGEIAAIHDLASAFTQGPAIVLKRLAHIAVELCSTGSAGVSLIEDGENGTRVFRWQALAGELEQHEGGMTPLDWSPCGACLSAGRPMLYSYPARYFTYFQKLEAPIVEGLVIPMYLDGLAVGTIWIISHNAQRFDAEDVRIMTSLGALAAGALRFAFNGGAGPPSTQTISDPAIERSIIWGEYIRRIAYGDQFALTAFLGETRPFVFATALKKLSFPADAEEVTADVYASVWRMAKSYEVQRGSVLNWLLAITRNRAIDFLRVRSTRFDLESKLLPSRLFSDCSDSVSPENSAAISEMRGRVRLALRALPSEQRRAIELAYVYGFTMAEIAQKLGHPIGTVKTRVRLALTRLRCVLAAAGVDSYADATLLATPVPRWRTNSRPSSWLAD